MDKYSVKNTHDALKNKLIDVECYIRNRLSRQIRRT